LANFYTFKINSSFELGTTQLPTSNFQVVEGQKTTPPLNYYDQLPSRGGAKIDEFWSSNATFSKEFFVYANGICDHEK